jgi:dTDP-4-dehydrorhamnose reductase
MSDVIILGNGILGKEIQRQTNWDIHSRSYNNFDINNSSFEQFKNYKVIVNCIANTNTYDDRKEAHWDTNYASVYKLALFCNENNIKLVQISSDFVYTNSPLDKRNELAAPCHFANWYSLTKLLADNMIELVCKDYLICRTTHKESPFKFEKAFIDRIGNFDYTEKISKLIIELITNNANGLYNVGTESKTMYSLAQETNPNVTPILINGDYPKNTSMDITKMQSFLNSLK